MNRILLPAAILVTLFPGPASARAQTPELLYKFRVSAGGSGGRVWPAKDMNRDGFPDFMVGEPLARPHSGSEGMASVRSGKDGSLLFPVIQRPSDDLFGYNMLSLDDVNGDGFLDFAVESSHHSGFPNGHMEIFSGRNGKLLLHLEGVGRLLPFQGIAAVVGDVDGDGCGDIINGYSNDDRNGSHSGTVMILSGRNGKILFLASGKPHSLFGRSFTGVGDVDGDGLGDFLVGAPFTERNFEQIGQAVLFSGGSGRILQTFSGDVIGDGFGTVVRFAGDVNRDGVGDFLFGLPLASLNGPGSGAVRVFSGSDFSLLFEVLGEPHESLGTAAGNEGDVDGDGFDDFLAGGSTHEHPYLVRIYSGRDGAILFDLVNTIDNNVSLIHGWDVDRDGFSDMAFVETLSTYDNFATVYRGAPPFRLFGPDPGLVGQVNTLTLNGAEPGARVTLLAGLNDRDTPVACLTGTRQLRVPVGHLLAGLNRTADAAGTLSISFFAPPALSGRIVRIIAVETATCRQTNLVTHLFP